MNFLNQIRTRIHDSLLRKNLPSHPIIRSSVSLEKAGSIGILFEGTQSTDRELVLKYAKKLKSLDKKVKLLSYFDNELKSENFTFKHFNKKQLDWAFRPKTRDVEDFTQQPFDLLINLSKRECLPLEYIAANSKARFRVGPSTEKDFSYDLMIEHSPKMSLQLFIDQIEKYLRAMEPGEIAAAV